MDIIPIKTLEQVQGIEFGCNWSQGSCTGMRKHVERGLKSFGKICCRGCAANRGYLRLKPDQPLPQEYEQYWNTNDGFWKENGCSLPKEMRSTRCLLYVCRDADISETDRNTLLELEKQYLEEKPWLLTQTAT